MIIWVLAWLYFRLEFSIDWGRGASLIIDLLPTVTITVAPADENGFRYRSIGFHFLIFGIVFQYYYPAIFKYNEVGEVIGKNSFPECSIVQMD